MTNNQYQIVFNKHDGQYHINSWQRIDDSPFNSAEEAERFIVLKLLKARNTEDVLVDTVNFDYDSFRIIPTIDVKV